MDFLPPFSTPVLGALPLLLFLCGFLWISRRNAQSKRMPPEARGALPIIGHLHLLDGEQPPHVSLGKLADKHGPIFTIKLGAYRTLIVSSWEMAKECLGTNDKAFASRPKSIAMEILGYNYAMFGFSPYGHYWRHARKIATLELLSNQRLETFQHVRESEITAWAKEMHGRCEKNKGNSHKISLDMKRWFKDLTLNLIFSIVLGRRYNEYTTISDHDDKENDPWRQALDEFDEFLSRFYLSDALPFLRWLDIGGQEKAMRKTAKKLDNVVQEWLEVHKNRRTSGKMNGEADFMDVMLSVLENEQPPTHDADTFTKATCLGIVLAASDATVVTLTGALHLLLNHPDALKKAQYEIDAIVGRERQVKEPDVKSFVYLHAVIKETLRLFPPAPLLVPHEATEDCKVGSYHIPKGTQLIVNASKIQRDSRVWENPSAFHPERFLTTHKDLDIRGQSFELIPFGSGRRICSGISFAFQVIVLSLATFLHGFDIKTASNEPVDMTEAGITHTKPSKLNILLSSRLPGNLYGSSRFM